MILSPAQIKIFDQIMHWYKGSKQTFVLAGYAGTGKTTLAKYIAEAIGEESVVFCAYTGKAVNVLREKGCHRATTIHGAIYKLEGEDEEDKTPYFSLNYNSDIKKANLVIVDEYSMLSKEIIIDLHKLADKILYLGDPFQLPPVNGQCDLEPNAFIHEIHRQALDSDIIRSATLVRENKKLNYCNTPEFSYMPSTELAPEAYLEADQVIVGYNHTRNTWNDRFRLRLGFEGVYPNKGEKLICLKNNREHGLFNGMIGASTKKAKLKGGVLRLSFDDLKNLEVWSGDFERNLVPDYASKFLDRFDYAYTITCHKSQGSEFDKVVIYNQPVGKGIERQRWLYTAITRGKKKVTLVEPI